MGHIVAYTPIGYKFKKLYTSEMSEDEEDQFIA
jgi:hypothetical protein